MKMKGQLDSIQPMKSPKKKQKQKSKKVELKKKKQDKLIDKKTTKEKPSTTIKKTSKPTVQETTPAKKVVTATPAKPVEPTKVVPITLHTSPQTEPSDLMRQRVSKHVQPLTTGEQTTAINILTKRLMMEEITQGVALRELRVRVLGLRQDAYSALVGVSRKTLSEIENDKGNYTPEIINKVFKPFDLKVGLVPASSQVLSAILLN